MIKTTDNMNSELSNQIKVADTTMESFRNIIGALNENGPKIKAINNSAISINAEKNSILQKIEQTSAVPEEISASSQEIVTSSEKLMCSAERVAATSQQLDNMAKVMMEEVDKFKISL
ncbi:methyl-accepting chemotaxis protein [Clostridium sp. 19966]|uniref:hypothetical protein n=1 Tax=Clostridium sp. 19966 TaxID=2768166 RepID=UPI0028DD8C11|nr:hypothetical protein [Clostridium sp. 19966]MDT8716925.1 methyl-accepting chemotaxis protein [Clostridium sp. 19966]